MDIQQEILDYVDDNDQVIGQCSRGEIHTRMLPHRAIHLLVRSYQGKFLLQQRSFAKDMHPGQWDTAVAGHVDSGESYAHCAVREAEEELGIKCSVTDLNSLFKLPAQEATGMEFCQVYLIDHSGPFHPAPEEIIQIAWYTIDELDELTQTAGQNITPTFSLIWSYFRNGIST